MIYAQKADDHLAGLVKSIATKVTPENGLVMAVVGVGELGQVELEQFQAAKDLPVPLAVPLRAKLFEQLKLSKDYPIVAFIFESRTTTVIHRFAFRDTKDAASNAEAIAAALKKLLGP